MLTTLYSLFDFLADCKGSWRNAVFISCKPCANLCKNQRRGALMVADRDGVLHVIGVSRLAAATGWEIDPTECYAAIDCIAFENMAKSYLLWVMDDPSQCPIAALDAQFDAAPPNPKE